MLLFEYLQSLVCAKIDALQKILAAKLKEIDTFSFLIKRGISTANAMRRRIRKRERIRRRNSSCIMCKDSMQMNFGHRCRARSSRISTIKNSLPMIACFFPLRILLL